MLRRAFELMLERAEELARLIDPGERQGAGRRARRGRATRPSSSAGTPRRPCAIGGTLATAPSGANRILVHAPADRRLRAGHAVELPGRDGDAQDRPGAGGRLHGGPQARQRHAADRARPGRDSWPRRACPPGVVNVLPVAHARRRRVGDAARRPGAQAVVHRLDRGRPDAAAEAATRVLNVLDGARRQRAVPRLRRRRHRRGGRRRDDRQDAQRRARPAPPPTGSTSSPGRRGVRRQARRAAMSALKRRARIDDGDPGRAAGQRGTPSTRSTSWSTTRSTSGAQRDHRRPPARTRGLVLPADRARRRAGRSRRSCARRSSARSPRSSPSTPRTRRSRLANDTEYGLVAYLYTGDLARGLRVAERAGGGHDRAQPRARLATRPRRSAGSRRAASAARAATRACSSTWRPSTSPSPGERIL